MDALSLLILGGAAVSLARLWHAWHHPQDTARLARLRRETQRENWRRIAKGEGLPPKMREWLEGL